MWNRFPGYNAQEMGDAIQSSTLFVVGLNYIPGRVRIVGSGKHCVACTRIVVPATMRFEIHRAEFPPSHWILDTSQKAPVLLALAHLKPVLDKGDAVIPKEG